LSSKLSLNVQNDHGELERIAAAIEDVGGRERWPSALLFKVNLVIEELSLNIMDHSYEAQPDEFDITIMSEDDAVTIEISDRGAPFDPLTEAPSPNTDAAVSDRQIGGLGIHLVRAMVDEASYRRHEGRNYLTLVTRRNE